MRKNKLGIWFIILFCYVGCTAKSRTEPVIQKQDIMSDVSSVNTNDFVNDTATDLETDQAVSRADGIIPAVVMLPSFDRNPLEPSCVDPEKLLNAFEEPTEDLKVYQQAIFDKTDAFLETLKTVSNIQNKELLVGEWRLEDQYGEEIEKKHKWDAGSKIIIFEMLFIDERKLYYIRQSSNSLIHYSEDNAYYITPQWAFGIIKQIKIYDGKLYLYILEHDTWLLDPIHESGKYFYIRHPLPEMYIGDDGWMD